MLAARTVTLLIFDDIGAASQLEVAVRRGLGLVGLLWLLELGRSVPGVFG